MHLVSMSGQFRAVASTNLVCFVAGCGYETSVIIEIASIFASPLVTADGRAMSAG